MGKFKRIPEQDIKAMGKTLDDLPDKTLGRTREEAADMLNAQIRRALEKGYSVRELTEIMGRGNVSIPASVIRARIASLKDAAGNIPPTGKPEKIQAKKVQKLPKVEETTQPLETPAYFTPDMPDSEL